MGRPVYSTVFLLKHCIVGSKGGSTHSLLYLLKRLLSRLFIAALWSPAGKGLISWLLSVMFNCVFVTFPSGILGQVWYLIVSIPDFCCLSYFVYFYNII